MSWCALWRKTWKAWSPPEIHSYSSRWSTGMLLWCLLLVWLAISSKTTFLFLLRYWDHPVLHPNHYLVVELCHSLVFAYAVLRLVDFCSTSSLFSRRRTLSSVFRPNLSRPEQERVIQISSHILSVRTKNYWTCVCTNHQVFAPSTKCFYLQQAQIICTKHQLFAPSTKCLHFHLHQVLGKVDSGFTQWRGTMLSVRFQFAFHSLDVSCSGSFLIHSGPFLMRILDF